MKYIIAPRSSVVSHGITPSSTAIVEGHIVVNENDLKFRYPDKPIEEIIEMVGGFMTSRVLALDFLKGRKTLIQVKQTKDE